jgi:hypothetical protein
VRSFRITDSQTHLEDRGGELFQRIYDEGKLTEQDAVNIIRATLGGVVRQFISMELFDSVQRNTCMITALCIETSSQRVGLPTIW